MLHGYFAIDMLCGAVSAEQHHSHRDVRDGDGTGTTGTMSYRRDIVLAQFEQRVSEGAERLTRHIMCVQQMHQTRDPDLALELELELLLSSYTTQCCLEAVLDDLQHAQRALPA
jgi:hypothetical protein